MSETNKLTKMYMLKMFQEMNRARAHSGLPQSPSRNWSPTMQVGGTTVAKSSIIWFQPSPTLMRKSRMSAFGTLRKLRLPFSLVLKAVRPNVWVSAIAYTRNNTNHVARRLAMEVRLAAAVLKS